MFHLHLKTLLYSKYFHL